MKKIYNGEKEFIVPSEFLGIGVSAFRGCKQLEKIVFHKDLEYIGYYAFSECSSLKSIVFSPKIKNISEAAFMGCRCL